MKRPNILFLIPHDLGTFINCYGYESVRSPNLNALAQRGVSFTHCFTTTAECTPSRGAMMTGLMPHQNGLMGLSNFGWSLTVPHLARRLRDAGYATHHFGFQHETHEPVETLGYVHAHHDGGSKADVVCGHICDFLDSEAARTECPWFVYAGFSNVHRPWPRATRFKPEDIQVPSWLPDTPVVRSDLARFHQDIEDMDAAVGEVLSTLRKTGLDEDTLTVFTTDHGAAFPGAKATMYDPGIQIPLFMHWPGRVEGGSRFDALLSSMDITPTLLEAGGAPLPDGLAGRSFWPLLNGDVYAERENVAGALFYDVAYDPMHYVRTKTHKYIRSFATTDTDARGADPDTLSSFAAGRWIRVDDFDVLTSPAWQALKPRAASPRPPAEELYDLQNDPDERTNLAADPAAESVLAEMRERLDRMMKETDSPLSREHVQPPERQRQAARSHAAGSERARNEIEKRRQLL